MGCQSRIALGNNLTFSICTHDPDIGMLTDADAAPVYRVYEDETDTPILTGTMAKLDDANTTGFYTERIACTTENGFETGKSYSIYISAAVGGVTGGISYAFDVETAEDPLTNAVPGSYADGTAGNALGRIGAGTAVVTQPVASSGDVTIYQGVDYNATDGTQLDWTSTEFAALDLTGATVNFYSSLFNKAGSVVTATGATKKIRIELTAAETLAAMRGTAPFAIIVTLSSARKILFSTGCVTVNDTP